MMRQMRAATKPIMLVTAIAFVALMVFTWGMDITGQSGGGPGAVGSVNGDAVRYDAYMAARQQIYAQVQRSQEQLISSQQNADIDDAAFDEVVNQLLIMQELDRRGITVSDREISAAANSSPPDYLRYQFEDDAGVLDYGRYQTFLLSSPPEQLLVLEAYYRDVIPRGKLQRQVSSGIYVSDADLWRQYRDQNEQVEIRYIPMNPATRYEDDQFSISDADVSAYYQAHQEEYEVPARASVKASVIDKTPTAADTVATEERAVAILQEIADGADFADIALRDSSDATTAALGGDLGVFPKNYMTPPFDSAVFVAPIGRLVGPIKTSFGYHILEVQERWAADSAQARHILIPIVRTDDSEIELLTLADSLEDLAEAMPLDQAAAAAGVSISMLDLSRDFPFVPGAGQVSEGADWLFEEASPGDVSPVFETPTAFYALELINSQPAGVLPLDDALPSIRATLLFDRKMEEARGDAQDVVDRVRSGGALVSVAAELDLEVRNAGPFSRTDFIPGIGRQNAAIGSAFGLRTGEVSGVVATPANAYVLEVLNHIEADSTAWLAQTPQQREIAILILKQRRVQEFIGALRAAARIVDRRDVVLAPQDDGLGQLPGVF
jgi:parvulin-like peptidyl-prolyl isomerase